MTIKAGTRLGPYAIGAPLGAGGMGEVYRAVDTRLERPAAIKVLATDVAADADRLRRFEREARAASALNHPNIVTIYEVGSAESNAYIAMELVEGKTLRELLVQGPLTPRRLLPLAAQMADGLAKAHAAGIVHRDLKPDNLMVTPDGYVKILDFGLAKLSPALDGGLETSARTLSQATAQGVVMGTVGYMSPEQASGQPVDFWSDQFSLGAVLYEAASGRQAFKRNTAVETLSAIIRDEPEPLSVVAPQVPAPLRWIVERCLAKEPKERYESTRDLARELGTLRDHLSETTAATREAGQPDRLPSARLRMAIAGAVLTGVVVGAILLGSRLAGRAFPTYRRLTFRRGEVTVARFTPDGQSAVFSAAWDGKPPQLFTTRLDSHGTTALEIPSANLLAVSRKGELAISLDGTLARVPLGGGGPREVLQDVSYADWSPDGELAVVHRAGGKTRIEWPIGQVLYETTGNVSQPRVSPDGTTLAFFDHPFAWSVRGHVAVLDRSGKVTAVSGEWRELEALDWASDGKEIWFTGMKEGTTLGDLHAVSLGGRERTVARSIAGMGGVEDVAPDGRVLMTHYVTRAGILGVPPGEMRERDLSWLDGSSARGLSDDGKTMLFSESGAGADSLESDIYLRKTDGSAAVRLGEGDPRSLSPDGKWAAAVVGSSSPSLILHPTGAGEKRVLARGPIARYFRVEWLPNGRTLFLTGAEPGKGSRVYLQDIEGGAPRPLTPEGCSTFDVVTPDGRFVLIRTADGKRVLFPVAGGEQVAIPGLASEDSPIRFDATGASLFVTRGRFQNRIERLDVKTGRRSLFREFPIPDVAGLNFVGNFRMTPDGSALVYNYARATSDLFLVEGLK